MVGFNYYAPKKGYPRILRQFSLSIRLSVMYTTVVSTRNPDVLKMSGCYWSL